MKCSDCRHRLLLTFEDESALSQDKGIQDHLASCAACRAMLSRLRMEGEVVTEAIGLERLPDSFTRSVLDQLEPYSPQQVPDVSAAPLSPRKRRKETWRRAAVAVCAAVFLGMAAGSYISPAFAAYVSSFMSRIGGELGLKRAAEQGFGIAINQAVTDQGITLRIKDIVADPTRLVVSYVLEDENGKEPPNLFVPAYEGNRIYLTDEAGNMINESPDVFQQGRGYADYTFMLKSPPNDLVLHFDITDMKPAAKKQGSWKLEVPVNLEKSREASSYTPIGANYSSAHGIDFTLEGVTYGPSATRFTLGTRRTPEEKERLKEWSKQGRDGASLGEYSLEYHIEDQAGRFVAGLSSDPPEDNRHIYFTPGYSSPPENTEDDTWRWYGAFVPSQSPEELWFVLDAIVKTEAADFSIQFRPSELSAAPVTKRYEEFSSSYTVKNMRQGTDPETNEPVWLIELVGMIPESDFPAWRLADETGLEYEVRTDYSTSSVSGDANGNMLEQTLIVKGMLALPKNLNLSLQTVKKRYDDLNWKVALPSK